MEYLGGGSALDLVSKVSSFFFEVFYVLLAFIPRTKHSPRVEIM